MFQNWGLVAPVALGLRGLPTGYDMKNTSGNHLTHTVELGSKVYFCKIFTMEPMSLVLSISVCSERVQSSW